MIFKFIQSGYQKLKSALHKTRSLLTEKILNLFSKPLDENTLEQLEQLLYESDLGVQASLDLTNKIRIFHKEHPKAGPEEMLIEIRRQIIDLLDQQSPELTSIPKEEGPCIIMIVGVNGNGKTTSVAKLAKRFTDKGMKVILAAADTFRAAATEQLELWSQQLNVEIVKGSAKSDPAAIAFDAVTAGKSRSADVVIIDTAGRLHTKTDLMQELEKIRRSCRKVNPKAPHETLLVLDATTGQNAIDQAKVFNKYTPITGIILTKLDGTAKGGIVLSIQQALGIPVKFIGLGESMEDLEPFNSESFVNALFE